MTKLSWKYYSAVCYNSLTMPQLPLLIFQNPLTGLPNRALFLDRLGKLLALASRNQRLTAVLYLDVIGFREISRTHGRTTGEAVLQETAQRLHSVMRGSDPVAYLGNNQFTLALPDMEQLSGIEVITARIREKFTHPFSIGDQVISVEVALGVAIAPRDGTTAEELLRQAEMATIREQTRSS